MDREQIRIALGPWLGFRPWRRHGLVLMMGGLVYLGYGLVIHTWTYEGPRARGIDVALQIVPDLHFWGYVWMFIGTLSILSARWPMMSEKWGYGILTGLAAGWSATYFAGVVTEGNTLSEAGGGLTWALVAFLWWAVAGLVNPETVLVEVVPSGSE